MGARRGGARVGHRLPPRKIFCLAILGAFLLRFCHFWCLLATFHGVGLFMGLPPPHTKISAGAHDCKEGSRACSPKIFWCDRNLVSSGHVLLRFCLKNEKNNDKL